MIYQVCHDSIVIIISFISLNLHVDSAGAHQSSKCPDWVFIETTAQKSEQVKHVRWDVVACNFEFCKSFEQTASNTGLMMSRTLSLVHHSTVQSTSIGSRTGFPSSIVTRAPATLLYVGGHVKNRMPVLPDKLWQVLAMRSVSRMTFVSFMCSTFAVGFNIYTYIYICIMYDSKRT